MADIKDAVNARANAEALKAQQDAASAAAGQAKTVEETKTILAEQNKIHFDTEEAAEQSAGSLAQLVDLVTQMLGKQQEQAATLAQISASSQAAAMAKGGDTGKQQVAEFKTIGGLIKTIIKAKIAEKIMNSRMGKFLNKTAKAMAKQNKKETKTVDAKDAAKPASKNDKKGPSIDSKMIAASMAASLAKNLNPMALVSAFFTKLLPILLVMGILLYGFITGFLDGDVADFIAAMVGIIIAAVLAYVAWMMIKEAITQGIKIACEFLKVAIEAAADWAAVYVIIAVIAVIALAFLVAAALVVVIIGAAMLGIVVAMFFLTKAIKAMLTDMIEDIMDVFEEQFEKLGDMIKSVVSTFQTLVPMLAEMMIKTADTLKQGIGQALASIEKTFAMMTDVMNHLAKEISDIFNGLAAAIIASTLGQAVQEHQKEMVNFSLGELHAMFDTSEKMWAMMTDRFGQTVDSIFGGMANTIMSNFETLAYESLDMLTNIAYTIITSIIAMTTAFIGLLFAMPLIGLLMGLVGSNSFSAAIAPLLETANEIKALLAELIKGNTIKETSLIKATAFNSNITGSEQFNTYHSPTNYIEPSDAMATFKETAEIVFSGPKRYSSDEIDREYLSEQIAGIRNDLNRIVIAVAENGKGKKGFWF